MKSSEARPALGRYRPVRSPRLHEVIVHRLVQQIVRGEIPPGALLPTETELAEQFGVSRLTVREAIRVLTTKGLVAVKQGSGMRVQPPEHWDQLDPLVLFERVRQQRNEQLLDDLLEARRIIEGEVAALAARRRTAQDIEVLQGLVDRMATALTDPEAYTALDVEFHDRLFVAAQNHILFEMLRPMRDLLRLGRLITNRQAGRMEESHRGHTAILAAIAQGDPTTAMTAMRAHIAQFERDIKAVLLGEQAILFLQTHGGDL
jgi:GntR family transcriptional repressor for pyruvate dehydrogenase complex